MEQQRRKNQRPYISDCCQRVDDRIGIVVQKRDVHQCTRKIKTAAEPNFRCRKNGTDPGDSHGPGFQKERAERTAQRHDKDAEEKFHGSFTPLRTIRIRPRRMARRPIIFITEMDSCRKIRPSTKDSTYPAPSIGWRTERSP